MRMRGRLRDVARATPPSPSSHMARRSWFGEAVRARRSHRHGRSPTQSLAGVILPGELADFPNPRTNSHIERGRLQGIGHAADKLPTRTLEIRDSRKAPQKPKTGEHRPISTSVTNSHTNPGHHRPPAHLKTISRNHPGFAPPANAPTRPMPLRPAQHNKNRTPKWACGRCTIELPGPSPAFDA